MFYAHLLHLLENGGKYDFPVSVTANIYKFMDAQPCNDTFGLNHTFDDHRKRKNMNRFGPKQIQIVLRQECDTRSICTRSQCKSSTRRRQELTRTWVILKCDWNEYISPRMSSSTLGDMCIHIFISILRIHFSSSPPFFSEPLTVVEQLRHFWKVVSISSFFSTGSYAVPNEINAFNRLALRGLKFEDIICYRGGSKIGPELSILISWGLDRILCRCEF